MATEPRQVEVVCDFCDGNGVGLFTGDPCRECLGQTVERKRVAPSSLAAAMLTLAEAVMAWENKFASNPLWFAAAHAEFDNVRAKIAAVRAHPDYVRPE